ncbi:hypothetical protein PSE10C_39550 [Pseudomonas amygdali pv. eriobotryae]|nr:hypothetical protein PSE10C_39550 [Pseudomonas amygdali pv. eriobotryae]
MCRDYGQGMTLRGSPIVTQSVTRQRDDAERRTVVEVIARTGALAQVVTPLNNAYQNRC